MILIQQALLAVAEPFINKALSYDTSAAQQMSKLEGKRFAVVLTDLNAQVSLAVMHQKLRLSANTEAANCKVTTSTKQINSLSDAAQLTALIKQDELALEGDLNIAQGFSNLLMNNQIDWQELLSGYLGDAMAYRVARGISALNTLINKKLVDMRYTSSTLLTDELKVAPVQLEVEAFCQQVQDTQAEVESLGALIQSLRNRS